MKTILLFCMALVTLFALPYAMAQSGALLAHGGVRDGSTWKNNSGNTVTVKVTAQTNGNMRVEYTDQNGNTGSTTSGTPHPGGGVKTSPEVTVGTDKYRIKQGRVQWRNPSTGHWINMYESSGGGTFTGFTSDPTVGTLP